MMRRILAAAVLLCATASAQAALITSAPSGGTTTVFTTTGFANLISPDSITIDGFVVTSDPVAAFGSVNYGFDENGDWVSFPWVAINSPTGSVTFALGGAYPSVGAFVNYAITSGAPSGAAPIITALDASLVELESYDIHADAPIVTPDGINLGAFRGISTGVNNIAYLRLSGSFIAAHSITVAAFDAPEPATLAVFGLGLAGLGLVRRKRA